jgi:hypothetical protein
MAAPTAGLVALALAPAAAHAAQVKVDRACYLENRKARVTVTGAGFDPGQPYQLTLDGRPLTGGAGTVDDSGAVSGTFVPPDVVTGHNEQPHTLGVSEGANAASTTFTVTKFFADFSPGRGNPVTLRVRFSAFGFGLVQADPLTPVAKTVYLHYVRPTGKLGRTVALGRTRGPCGHIARTSRRRLFGFAPEAGTWNLQFDTNAAYHHGSTASSFAYYAVGVRIKPPSRR